MSRRTWAPGAIAAGVCGGAILMGATALAAGHGGRPFSVELSGANEVNASGAPINAHGDADRGRVELTINPGREEVCWSFGALTLSAGEALPHLAHIHAGEATTAGPVVIDLFGGSAAVPAPASYPTETVCVHADRDVIMDVMKDPSAYYVNLHNAQHPAGVMRGQLSD
jgi:hypothetical protein